MVRLRPDRCSERAKYLRITYYGLDENRVLDIFINGELLQTVNLDGSKGDTFIDVDYELPGAIIESGSGVIR